MLTDTGNHIAGLGFRREIASELLAVHERDLDFFEVAPENWLGVGGKYGAQFAELAERFPVFLHGLSLNIGGVETLDVELLKRVRAFIGQYRCPIYSEHLSYCADDGHLYDLMPIPFRADAVSRVAARVKQAQDILGQRLALENVSFYAAPEPEMSELEFVNAVLSEADCDLLLDVNNVYVNSVNHCYDPLVFLRGLPKERVKYMHIAGHFVEAQDLLVDTHGADVCDPVWQLLDEAYRLFGVKPTLLERDFNFPAVPSLLEEVRRVKSAQTRVNESAGGSQPLAAS